MDFHKLLKAGGLRKVFVGLCIYSCNAFLLYCHALDAGDFASLSKLVVLALLPSMAIEHFAPKDTASGA
jgi:hypothetical protein